MRDRVTIEERTEAQSPSGAVTWTWTTFCGPVWAEVAPLRGALQFAAQQLQDGQPFTVRVRYRPGVRVNMRVAWAPECSGTQYLEITAVAWDTPRTMLELTCHARGADGYRNEK